MRTPDPRNIARTHLVHGPTGKRWFYAEARVFTPNPKTGASGQCGFYGGVWPTRALAQKIAEAWKALCERPDHESETWKTDRQALLELTQNSRRTKFEDPKGTTK